MTQAAALGCQSQLLEPERAIVAAAAANFLTSVGKPISMDYVVRLLRHTNNFVTMCEHFDSLGHRYDRGDLARYLLDAIAQMKTTQGFSPAIAAPPPPRPDFFQQSAVLGQKVLPSIPITARPHTTLSPAQNTPPSQGAVPTRTATSATQQIFNTSPNPDIRKNPSPMNAGRSVLTDGLTAVASVPIEGSAAEQPPLIVGRSAANKNPQPQPPMGHFSTAIPAAQQRFISAKGAVIDYISPPAPSENFGQDAMEIDSCTTANVFNRDDAEAARSISSTFSGLLRTNCGLLSAAVAGFQPNGDAARVPVIDLTQTDDTTIAGSEDARVSRKPPGPKQPLADRIDRKKAARVSKYDSKNIARNILIIAQRHPTERSLNAHLLPLKENLPGQIDWDSDLSTIRWDIIDPEPIVVDNGMYGDDEDDGNPVRSEENGNPSRAAPDPTPVVPGKRGMARKSAPGGLTAISQASVVAGTPKNGRTKHATTISQSAPHHAPSLRTSLCARTTTIANVPSSAIIIDSHLNSPNSAAMEPGPSAKRRRTDKLARLGTGSTTFKKYRCRWKDCAAELHNIDNLKRHIKQHKQKNVMYNNNGYPCNWEGCACPPTAEQIIATKGRKDTLQPMVWHFANEEEWEKHVYLHVEEVKQSLGVGPAALLSGKLPRFHPATHTKYISANIK
jgi:hypothetical protein